MFLLCVYLYILKITHTFVYGVMVIVPTANEININEYIFNTYNYDNGIDDFLRTCGMLRSG